MQADGGLPGPWRALDADRLGRARPHDVVLIGLDRRHDIAHRARPGALDLLDHDAAQRGARLRLGLARLLERRAECLVLVRGELAAAEPEPAPPGQAHRLALTGTVERPGQRCPPVDHDWMAVRVVHVAPADVELLSPLAPAVARFLAAGRAGGLRCARVVETAEEQRGVGHVPQRLRPPVQVGPEILLRHPVARQGGQREHVLAHQPQVLSRAGQVFLLGRQDLVRFSVFVVFVVFDGRGHGAAPR